MAEDTILYNTIFIFIVTDSHLKNGAYEQIMLNYAYGAYLATANAVSSIFKDLHVFRSIEISASADNLSWLIVDLRYVFISFKAEKLLSPAATVMGSVSNRRRAMLRFPYKS